MTPEEQNWAISDIVAGGLDPHTMSPCDGREHLFIHRPNGDYECLDYTSDLTAMHEAERTLTCLQSEDYGEELRKICQSDWFIYHATAAQRAEAFLKTLNLWTDNR